MVRRFKCDRAACPQSIFSEQIPGLTTPFARRTPLATEQLVAIALALAGRARGSELAAWLDAVEADNLPALRTFAAGIRR